MTQSRGNKNNDSELKNITGGIETRKIKLGMVACSYNPSTTGWSRRITGLSEASVVSYWELISKKIIRRNQTETLDRDNNNKYEKKSSKNFNSRVNRVREKIGDLEDKAAEIKPDPDAPRENDK